MGCWTFSVTVVSSTACCLLLSQQYWIKHCYQLTSSAKIWIPGLPWYHDITNAMEISALIVDIKLMMGIGSQPGIEHAIVLSISAILYVRCGISYWHILPMGGEKINDQPEYCLLNESGWYQLIKTCCACLMSTALHRVTDLQITFSPKDILSIMWSGWTILRPAARCFSRLPVTKKLLIYLNTFIFLLPSPSRRKARWAWRSTSARWTSVWRS